jgi:hypothetical protein
VIEYYQGLGSCESQHEAAPRSQPPEHHRPRLRRPNRRPRSRILCAQSWTSRSAVWWLSTTTRSVLLSMMPPMAMVYPNCPTVQSAMAIDRGLQMESVRRTEQHDSHRAVFLPCSTKASATTRTTRATMGSYSRTHSRMPSGAAMALPSNTMSLWFDPTKPYCCRFDRQQATRRR